jgi:cytochrome P450
MFSDYAATTQLGASLAGVLLVYGIFKISTLIYNELTSPLRHIPGPSSPSLIYGSFKQLSESNNYTLQDSWINQYGPTIQFKAVLRDTRAMTTDLKANNYVLFNSYDYQKPRFFSHTLREVFGNGLLVVEGDVHKHQRKILNPAFGPQQIRELTEIFITKALELRDIWSTEIGKNGGEARIECLSWMSRTTLDIIGLAGFNYNFNALSNDPEKNELMKSFSALFKAGQRPSIIPILKSLYPFLRFLRAPTDAARKKAHAVMNRIGTGLVKQSKAFHNDDKGNQSARGKNILSLLVHANTVEKEAERITDDDVMAQIPTFLIAGHETTSITMTWALYALTQNKDAQTKLREEVSSLSTDEPSMDDLNGLHYLDFVVRETLRLYPPVPSVTREAMKDDCIPLSKPFTDTKGMVRNEIRIRKGQSVMIPICLINRDKSIWGEDSTEFKPERWANIPDAAASVHGVWSNLLTFIGGPRACIGYRFSLVETKALLFTLIRAFEFELAVPAKDLVVKPVGFQRPILLTDPNNSNQMPLILRPVSTNL